MDRNISADKLEKLEEKYGVVWSTPDYGTKAESLCERSWTYSDLPDGEYTLISCQLIDTGLFDRMKGMNAYERLWHASSTKAIVKDGYWDVESVMKATDELLKQTGYHGYFIENFAKAKEGAYSFADRDLDLKGGDVLVVHIGS
tara:strand:+ start:179 stop:610 length:432 start_codon:yes stop_codon:yes gene_type:complete